MSAWTERPDAARSFASYCAPTVLAKLEGIDKVEAAQIILDAGVTARNRGAVRSAGWHAFIRDRYGGRTLATSEMRKPDADEVMAEHRQRYYERMDEYYEGERHDPPRLMYSIRYMTVAQFLRANPQGTYVISTGRHTLLASYGEVVADSMSTKSKRGRLKRVTTVPGWKRRWTS